jgi:hypothetical protein
MHRLIQYSYPYFSLHRAQALARLSELKRNLQSKADIRGLTAQPARDHRLSKLPHRIQSTLPCGNIGGSDDAVDDAFGTSEPDLGRVGVGCQEPPDTHLRATLKTDCVPTAGLGQLLEPIQSFCIIKELTPLTAIVVQQETGLPGSGFTGATAADFGKAQAQVFSKDWLEHGNPQPEELENAVVQHPSRP